MAWLNQAETLHTLCPDVAQVGFTITLRLGKWKKEKKEKKTYLNYFSCICEENLLSCFDSTCSGLSLILWY